MPTLVERLKEVFSSEKRQRDASEAAALESWAIAQRRLSLDANARAMLPAKAEVERAVESSVKKVAILSTTDASRTAEVKAALNYGEIASETRKNDMGIYTTYVAADDLAAAKHWITLGQDQTVRTGAQGEYAVSIYATTDPAKQITTEARLAAAHIESHTRVDANGVALTYVHKDDVADARSALCAASNAWRTQTQQADQQASYSVGM